MSLLHRAITAAIAFSVAACGPNVSEESSPESAPAPRIKNDACLQHFSQEKLSQLQQCSLTKTIKSVQEFQKSESYKVLPSAEKAGALEKEMQEAAKRARGDCIQAMCPSKKFD